MRDKQTDGEKSAGGRTRRNERTAAGRPKRQNRQREKTEDSKI